ncbi:hypothetical protein PP7435_CHR3-1045 [Komagataella phaffii CBS 7435]|nr:GQ67_03226T0 [Komagataella phaffii]AOA68718.1 GQ68_03195T0 [Komagataella phaffii GS115]CAH2450055.1 hypothetical protein BQ9382_C3-5503 [Komagataella phaffii CBS 7435]CCA39990.1 hypothetical protein PP7435_CHR3-1045 [Komagataella phaffii CBS 7435]
MTFTLVVLLLSFYHPVGPCLQLLTTSIPPSFLTMVPEHYIGSKSVDEVPTSEDPRVNACPYICDIGDCSRGYSRASHLKRHKETFHLKTRVFHCPIEGCGRSFNRKDVRDRHYRRHAADISDNSLGSGPHTISIVGIERTDENTNPIEAQSIESLELMSSTPLTPKSITYSTQKQYHVVQTPKFILGNLICTGRIFGINGRKGSIPQTTTDQTHHAIRNVCDVLREAKASLDEVIRVSVFLVCLEECTAVQSICSQYFPDGAVYDFIHIKFSPGECFRVQLQVVGRGE